MCYINKIASQCLFGSIRIKFIQSDIFFDRGVLLMGVFNWDVCLNVPCNHRFEYELMLSFKVGYFIFISLWNSGQQEVANWVVKCECILP